MILLCKKNLSDVETRDLWLFTRYIFGHINEITLKLQPQTQLYMWASFENWATFFLQMIILLLFFLFN